MIDLSLVSFDDLIEEAEKRCSEFVLGYCPIDFSKEKIMQFKYNKGSWFSACALSNILNNDVLNNWNGEMETLQKINGDDE